MRTRVTVCPIKDSLEFKYTRTCICVPRAKKNGKTLSYMEYLYGYQSVTHLHTHTNIKIQTERKLTVEQNISL